MATTLATKLSALAHQSQRQVLMGLLHHNPQDDTPVDGDDLEFEDELLEILFDLRHYHLPELESEGFINYDRDTHTVTKGTSFEEIEPLLKLIDGHPDELPDDWL